MIHVLLLLALALSAANASATQIEAVRLWPSPDNTRLVFDMSAPVKHSLLELKNPTRVVLDITQTRLNADLSALVLSASGIAGIRHATRNQGDLRIVLDMAESMQPTSFVLPPNEQYGDRLVVDLQRLDLGPAVVETVSPPTITKTISDIIAQRRDIVVVIDAGHGGEDPGAIGPSRLREKNVVFSIAKELQRQLEEIPGFQPLLVRTGDYIVALSKRREFARTNNADLFVSIHADAFHKSSANGASVYALSDGGSVSAVAKYLADQENAADVIGGINGVSLEDKDEVLKSVLLDLSMTATVQQSLQVGAEVLNEMGKFAKLHGGKKKVGQANFVVLRAPDVPSILVETGFISNPVEEKNLGSFAYRKRMASAIKTGIVRYFNGSPPPGTYLAWQQQANENLQQYRVVRGDTLSAIAVRNGTTVAQIIALNNLSSSSIRVGQVLLLPES